MHGVKNYTTSLPSYVEHFSRIRINRVEESQVYNEIIASVGDVGGDSGRLFAIVISYILGLLDNMYHLIYQIALETNDAIDKVLADSGEEWEQDDKGNKGYNDHSSTSSDDHGIPGAFSSEESEAQAGAGDDEYSDHGQEDPYREFGYDPNDPLPRAVIDRARVLARVKVDWHITRDDVKTDDVEETDATLSLA